jgi:membrane protein DedA with SNARE-associated domain
VPPLPNDILSKVKWLRPFANLFLAHPYLFLFVGLLLGGETILLPAIYLALTGIYSIYAVMGIMILATVISDLFWYFIGRGIMPSLTKRMIKERVRDELHRLLHIVHNRPLHILYLSKFVYGTRIAAQVMCGMKKAPLWKYLLVNIFGIISLGLLYVIIVKISIIFVLNVERLKNNVFIVLGIMVLITAIIHVTFYTIAQKKWSQ